MRSRKKDTSVLIQSHGKPSRHFLSLRPATTKSCASSEDTLSHLFERPSEATAVEGSASVNFIQPPSESKVPEPLEVEIEPVSRTRSPIVLFFIGTFVLVVLIFIVRDVNTLKNRAGRVLGAASAGVAGLRDGQEAGSALDFQAAHLSFSLARQSFSAALASLESLNNDVGAIASVIPFAGSARQALLAANELSEAGRIAAATGDALPRAAASGAPFLVMEERLDAVAEHLMKAQRALNDMPLLASVTRHADELDAVRSRIDSSVSEMQSIRDVVSFLNRVFGGSEPKRYLVFFQNDAELRATGGFWGSFALVDFASGKLTNVEIPGNGTYALQGDLRKRVTPPLPIAYLRDRLELQDANWYFDLPTSAKKAQEFFSWSGGSSVDGIITINARLLPRLLEITGPLAIPAEQKVLTSKNVLFELQRSVELEHREDGQGPKSILGSAGPLLLERLFAVELEGLPVLLDAVVTGLVRGDIQFALNDAALAENAKRFGWDGSIPEVEGDFLAVVDTNIAGGKTDAVITEDITYDVSFIGEGSLVSLTTVTRAHNGSPKQGPFIGVTNRDFMRLYVSPRAKVVDVLGLSREPDLERKIASDISTPDGFVWDETIHAYRGEELGKQVIAGWLIIRPGEQRSMSMRSISTSSFDQDSKTSLVSSVFSVIGLRDETRLYRFYFEPQSGKGSGTLSFRLQVPEKWEVAHATMLPQGERQAGQVVATSGVADSMRIGIILKLTP